MTVNLALLLAMGVMFGAGIYMLLERNLTRILLGIVLLTNASILLLLISAGDPGVAPIRIEGIPDEAYNDPVPQALMLTAIVIGFAVTAFLVAMIYRSWLLSSQDEIEIDAEDLKVATQDAFDAEEDAELEHETSEFLDDARDPNADYEHTTQEMPQVRQVVDRDSQQGSSQSGGERA
ncbi:MAG: Na(+)/H(+) antiporter subunit C [Micrococcus sp.]|nr:Na(+)/H(+) antiporter subunit C [Micrococcus sp.]